MLSVGGTKAECDRQWNHVLQAGRRKENLSLLSTLMYVNTSVEWMRSSKRYVWAGLLKYLLIMSGCVDWHGLYGFVFAALEVKQCKSEILTVCLLILWPGSFCVCGGLVVFFGGARALACWSVNGPHLQTRGMFMSVSSFTFLHCGMILRADKVELTYRPRNFIYRLWSSVWPLAWSFPLIRRLILQVSELPGTS